MWVCSSFTIVRATAANSLAEVASATSGETHACSDRGQQQAIVLPLHHSHTLQALTSRSDRVCLALSLVHAVSVPLLGVPPSLTCPQAAQQLASDIHLLL